MDLDYDQNAGESFYSYMDGYDDAECIIVSSGIAIAIQRINANPIGSFSYDSYRRGYLACIENAQMALAILNS